MPNSTRLDHNKEVDTMFPQLYDRPAVKSHTSMFSQVVGVGSGFVGLQCCRVVARPKLLVRQKFVKQEAGGWVGRSAATKDSSSITLSSSSFLFFPLFFFLFFLFFFFFFFFLIANV